MTSNALDKRHLQLMQTFRWQFEHYRTKETRFNVNDYPIELTTIPSRLPNEASDIVAVPEPKPWSRRFTFRRSSRGKDLDAITNVFQVRGNKALQQTWVRLGALKDFFDEPRYKYQKTLGYGGLGLCAQFRYEDPGKPGKERDIVVKVARKSWVDKGLRTEEREMRKLSRAAHIVQVVPPEDIGKDAKRKSRPEPAQDDSSDDEDDSSGDEDVAPPAKKKSKSTMTDEELLERASKWDLPIEQRKGFQRQEPSTQGQEKDYLILEFVENGDLSSLVAKVVEEGKKIPNRILWRFWLCLVKQCIAMAFPPRKFHADRKLKTTGDLDETMPPLANQWRMKRMVHFDIDPLNVFINALEANSDQHSLVPRLKLGDFGMAEEIKVEKRDCYYVHRRWKSKDRYFAPEQFAEEWDLIPADRNGANIASQAVAGNYGPPMNVWGIGLSMWSLITLCYPIHPPEAGHLNLDQAGEDGSRVITYGSHLLDKEWDHVDPELRRVVVRCLCHDPAQRPGLAELLQTAEGKCQKAPGPGEDDDSIRKWMDDILHNAPKSQDESSGQSQ